MKPWRHPLTVEAPHTPEGWRQKNREGGEHATLPVSTTGLPLQPDYSFVRS